jgi:Reverse transcriptase (RNA-dependent DNA polymerase)
MFVKEKYLANGEYDKLKARLVAGGHMQDKSLYDDLSAPTASASGVFTVLAIAAKEERLTAVIDIGGAFLHASMNTEIPVYMRLDSTLTSMLVELNKEHIAC